MDKVTLIIDGIQVEADKGATVLQAAQSAGIYIPGLCSHPDLPSSREVKADEVVYRGAEAYKNDNSAEEVEGCQLCLVEIEGIDGLPTACTTDVTEGMVVQTDTPQVQEKRRENLTKLLLTHPHFCLTCPNREGCIPFDPVCPQNVNMDERCCIKLNHNCEVQAVAEYIGIDPNISRYISRDLPRIKDEPLFDRDYNFCINCTRCVRVCREVRGVDALGFVFQDGKVIVGTKAPTLKESECKFCGACVEVCPTGALMDRDIKLAEREAKLVPCKSACPAEIDVPRYVRLIKEEKLAEAVAVIREKVPFPAVLGHICLHFCEDECRRGQVNEAIAIRALKRYAAENDNGLWKQRAKQAPATDKKVAIVGSGPAGLTAAYYLAKLGHSVTIFEELPVVGGMMIVGIPAHRLSREVLDKEIEEILNTGVKIKTNTKIESLGKFLEQGYDATLLAVGAHHGQKLPIPGVDLDGVLINTPFLREVNLGKEVKMGKRVVVLGGGNVALDCARTALRLGVTNVIIACLEAEDSMLSTPEETAWGQEEGITIHNSQSFTRILGENGKVSGVECLDVKSFEFDDEGKLHVECVADSEHVLSADTVIFAIGQLPELELIEGVDGIKTTKRGTLEADSATLATGKAGVFAAGDAVTGTTSAIEAIAAGRQAAISIDRYLGGNGEINEKLIDTEAPNPFFGREEDFADRLRAPMPCLPVEQRLGSFDEVELGFDEAKSIDEASRCLQCDTRLTIAEPVLPPEKWLEFNAENISTAPEKDGVVQLINEEKEIIYIKGTSNLRQELDVQLSSNQKARYFDYEETFMYTGRESELLQKFLQEHGKLPEGNDELEDLFD